MRKDDMNFAFDRLRTFIMRVERIRDRVA